MTPQYQKLNSASQTYANAPKLMLMLSDRRAPNLPGMLPAYLPCAHTRLAAALLPPPRKIELAAEQMRSITALHQCPLNCLNCCSPPHFLHWLQNIEIWTDARQKAAAKIQAAWRGYLQRKAWFLSNPERAKRDLVCGVTDIIIHASSSFSYHVV